MQLTNVAKELLKQLDELCKQLGNSRYSQPIDVLMSASIGGHVRHGIEFFLCIEDALENDKAVNYDTRKRDERLHSDVEYTCTTINRILRSIDKWPMKHVVALNVEYPYSNVEPMEIPTNLERELVYLIEHLVHHMALIRVGVNHCYKEIKLQAAFGVAQSTLKHSGYEA